jgi:phospholipase/lecithinase/hemolysin
LSFAECNPSGAAVTAQMRASVGAKVADVVAAIDTFFATGGSFGKRDLVTVLVGTHDILELYESVTTGALTEAAARAEAERRGELLAEQFDRITNESNTAGRALYVPVPDLSETPFGIGAEEGRTERVRLLRLISESFNNELRAQITNNGRSIGLVDAFQLFRNIVRAADDNDTPEGFVNVTDAACTVALPDCTTLTLKPTADALTWMWADGTRLSAGGHEVLADRAIDITENNPF